MSSHSFATGTVHVYFLSGREKKKNGKSKKNKKNKKIMKKVLKSIRNVQGSERDMKCYINESDDENLILTVDGHFRDTKTIRTVLCIEKWLRDLNETLSADELAGVDSFNIYVGGDGKPVHITAEDFDDYKWTKIHFDTPTLVQAFMERDRKIIDYQKRNGFTAKKPDTKADIIRRCFGAYCEYLAFTGEKLFDEPISLKNGNLKIETRKRKAKRISARMKEFIDYLDRGRRLQPTAVGRG